MKPKPAVLGLISDPHIGSPTGVCPPQGVELPQGARYVPGPVQRWLWDDVWLPYIDWLRDIKREVRGDFYLVTNGDAMDAHEKADIISRDPEKLLYLGIESYRPFKKLNPVKVWFTRGTSSHVGGEDASLEEALAHRLHDKLLYPLQRMGHQWTWWELDLVFYGTTVQVAHHGRVGSKEHTRQSNAAGWANDIRNQYQNCGLVPPSLVVRAHCHQLADSGLSLLCPVRYVVQPCMQIKNAFAHKVSANRPLQLSDIGGLCAIFYPNGTYELRSFIRRPVPSKPSVIK